MKQGKIWETLEYVIEPLFVLARGVLVYLNENKTRVYIEYKILNMNII